MAKGNPILGTMQGTIGDVTTYNYNGKQVTRVRRRTIRNPRTSKQAIQRTIASTVAKFVSAFAPVLNNSLQNEGSKVSTLAKIRSLNMNMLRQLAAQNKGAYAEKGSMYVAPNPYLISRGTLTGITPADSSVSLRDGSLIIPVSQIDVRTAVADQKTASQVFKNVAVGDQITFLCAWLEDLAEGSHVAYCRFAFKNDTTPALIEGDDGSIINPAAVDLTKAEGPWQSLVFQSVNEGTLLFGGSLIGESYDNPLDMAGVIVSREADKLRSTAYMQVNSFAGTEYTLADVYPTYMGGTTPIDVPSDIYLNNDANVV